VIEHYYKPLLAGQEASDITGLLRRLDSAVKSARYAKCAVDFALHDLTGKLYGLPVCVLLGGAVKNLSVSWVLSAKSPGDIQMEAAEKAEEGYRTFKLKVGTNADSDVENLAALRSAVGDSAKIRLDGNEGWDPKQALNILERFIPYRPEHLEQPVPAWNMEGLRFVRDRSPVPIVADECILTPKDAMHVARENAADRVNIKISRAGGIVDARKIAAVAQAAGQCPFAGSNLELGIGTIASAHLFAALPEANLTTELVGPLLLKEDIVRQPVVYQNGQLTLSDAPGFGIEPDHTLLAKYAC
jgi:muconate cycloisomerase